MRRHLMAFLFGDGTARQTAAKNTIWLGIGQVSSRLVRSVLVIYSARVLGAAEYGVLSYALSLAGLFTVLSDLGLGGFLTKELSRRSERADAYRATVLGLRAFNLIISGAVIILAIPFLVSVEGVSPLLPIVALIVVFDNLRNYSTSIVRARNRMDLETLFNFATEFFVTGIGLAVIFLAPAAATLSWGYATGSFLGFLASMIVLRKDFRESLSGFDRRLVMPILFAAVPFSIIGFLGNVLINIDVFVIGLLKSATDIGLYSAAQRIVQILYIVPAILGAGVFPVLNRLIADHPPEKAALAIERTLTLSLMAALPVGVGGAIVASDLMRLVFGTAFTDASLSFQILLATTLFIFPGWIVNNAVFAYGRQRVFVIATTVGVLGNLALDFALIPRFGIAGASAATVIIEALVFGIAWRALRREAPVRLLSHLPRILAATALMGGVTTLLAALHVSVVPNIALSGICYALALVVLREPILFRDGKAFLAQFRASGD